jgi:osmotically-inducible protein OsmY
MAQCGPPPEGGVGAGDSSSGGGIPIPPETDQEVIDAVRTAFFLDPILEEDAFDVLSIDRVVYLRGVVSSPDLKQRAAEVAAKVQGVNRVVNQLRVAGPAP